MIQAVIFDLDGTLVQTERLKASAYARAAVSLCPNWLTEEAVIEAFKEVVGRSRQEVAETLVARFGLEETARKRAAEFGVDDPWEVLVRLRLGIYQGMLADAELLRRNQWPHNVALLHEARRHGCAVGLATMSYREQVRRVLGVLALEDAFDAVVTRDDVKKGKPDPEIYLLAARKLGFSSEGCLVIEDSAVGVRAALAAGMDVIAVSTPLTKEGLHALEGLPQGRLVDDPGTLPVAVRRAFEERGSAAQWA